MFARASGMRGRLGEKAMYRVNSRLWLMPLAAALLSAELWGQAAVSASITGRVTDDSGAAIPNVSVTVKSPALQVAQLNTVTDNEGTYRFPDLPAPGVYETSFA